MKFTPKNHEYLTQDFNEVWAKSVSEQEFVDSMRSAPFWCGVPEREQELRKAWRVMSGKPVDGEAAQPTTPKEAKAEQPAAKKGGASKGNGG
jgi:hypothetical protein